MVVIRKVWERTSNNQKMVTIPKHSDIEPGDYVKIKRVKDEENNQS